MSYGPWPILAGCALDALLGDPQGWPHPVRAVGCQISFEEDFLRTRLLPAWDGGGAPLGIGHAQAERLAGVALAVSTALALPLAAGASLRLARRLGPAWGFALESFMCYQVLAARSLRDESMAVHGRLAAADLPGARRAVSMIVGRDTDALDAQGVARAAVETVAENASDGVVAPLLYLGAGGVPAAMLYKAANTADSMLGYRTPRYRHLGWASARLDDVLNFVPARVSGVLMCAAAGLSGLDARGAWRIFRRDRLKHASPNAANPEAACAGALGIRLGGASSYFGAVVEKPAIGEATRPVEADDIVRANRLMGATAALGAALSVALAAQRHRRARRRGKEGRHG